MRELSHQGADTAYPTGTRRQRGRGAVDAPARRIAVHGRYRRRPSPEPGGLPRPCTKIAPVRLGMPLIDAANVGELVAVRARLSRYSFLLALAPPGILGMTGIPVNPLAIF